MKTLRVKCRRHACLHYSMALVVFTVATIFVVGLTIRSNILKRKDIEVFNRELDQILHSKRTQYPKSIFKYIPRSNVSLATHTQPFFPQGCCLTCFEMLSLHPRVYLFDRVFSKDEANHLISVGLPLLSLSGVFAKKSIQSNVRSSRGARLPNSDSVVSSINERLLFIVNNFNSDRKKRKFRAGFAERLELLKYEGTQSYYGHLDGFGGIDGQLAKKRRKLAAEFSLRTQNAAVSWKQISEPLLDRGATMILFLNNLHPNATGGHTTFPFAQNKMTEKFSDESNVEAQVRWKEMLAAFRPSKDDPCKQRTPGFLMQKPRVGSVVLFYDMYENGVTDPFSLHAGCPPINQEELTTLADSEEKRALLSQSFVKFVATKWFMIPIVEGVARPSTFAG